MDSVLYALSKKFTEEYAIRNVKSEYVFLTQELRDSYFDLKPEEKTKNVSIVIKTPDLLLQVYDGENWVDMTGVISGKDGKDGGGQGVDGDGVLYWRASAKDSPIMHDLRIRKNAQYFDFERWDGSTWTNVARLGGSVSSDRFILDGEYVSIANKLSEIENLNIWRPTSTPNGNEFGSSKREIYLTSASQDGFKMTYPSGLVEEVVQSIDTVEMVDLEMQMNYTPSKTIQIEFLKVDLYKQTKGKLEIYDVADNRKIYETMNNAEFIETGGVIFRDYLSGQTTGPVTAKTRNVAYLIKDREYKIVIKVSESGFKGDGSFPKSSIVGSDVNIETIASRQWITNTMQFRKVPEDGTFFLYGFGNTDGDIRIKVIDGKINYEERQANGTWEIATIEDINLGSRGLLSERLDALENAREFKGSFDATGAMSQLNNAVKGYYWIVSVPGTIAGKVLGANDMIICHTNISSPSNFDNFSIIPSTVDVMQGATESEDGTQGVVPKPLKSDVNKFLKATGEWGTPENHTFYGDVKHSFIKNDHSGWVLLDGRSVNLLSVEQKQRAASLGIDSNIPNMVGKYAVGTPSGSNAGDAVGSKKITRSDLPSSSITTTSGLNDVTHRHNVGSATVTTTESGGNHSHSINPPNTTTGGESQNHTHGTPAKVGSTGNAFESGKVPQFEGGTNWGLYRSFNGSDFYVSGRSTDSTLNSTNLQHSHTFSIPRSNTEENNRSHTHDVNIGSFDSENANTNHTHEVTVSGQKTFTEDFKHRHDVSFNLNGNVSQTEFKPESVAMNVFIYLGA